MNHDLAITGPETAASEPGEFDLGRMGTDAFPQFVARSESELLLLSLSLLAAGCQRRQEYPRSNEQEIGDGNPSRETHHLHREAANVWHPADQVPRER